MLAQTGQMPDHFTDRIFPFAGDGLTYIKMIELKKYLQFHSNEVESLEILEPMLEWWHTLWTDLSRIFAAHWGSDLNSDPSTIGHSATKIGRKKPTNLGKVDYYSNVQLAYLILDIRILDCWRLYFKQDDIFNYFKTLNSEKAIPPIEDLEAAALQLYRSYTSHQAQLRAMDGAHNGI